MERNDFEAISMEHIVAANATAMRMLEELKKIGNNDYGYRKLYFTCIEMFEIIYGNIDEESAYDRLHWILDDLKHYQIGFTRDGMLYNIFWNAIITSRKDGTVCNVDEFLKYLRMKFGERAMIVSYVTNISEKLYPNCNGIDLESYRFDFSKQEKLYRISFNGRIPQNEIQQMLRQVDGYSPERMIDGINLYLDQHHLEYSKLKRETLYIDNKFVRHLINRTKSDVETFLTDILKIDHYYMIMYHVNWEDDFRTTSLGLIKYENKQFNIICQRHGEDFDDDYYDEDYHENYFYTQTRFRNIWNDNEIYISKMQEILPIHSYYRTLIELLLNMDHFDTIEQVKELVKKWEK